MLVMIPLWSFSSQSCIAVCTQFVSKCQSKSPVHLLQSAAIQCLFIIIITYRFCILLFSAREQTHCAHVVCQFSLTNVLLNLLTTCICSVMFEKTGKYNAKTREGTAREEWGRERDGGGRRMMLYYTGTQPRIMLWVHISLRDRKKERAAV